LNKNTSSRVITQPKVIRQEPNSNLNCNSSRYSLMPNIKSIYQRTSKKSLDNFKFESFSWRPLIDIWYLAISRWVTFEARISFRSNDIWLSYGPWTCIFCSNLKLCNSSRYSQIPNINQRTSRKTLDNLKFEQKYKFKGHNSAKSHSTGTKFELKL
jgi:hypothetical protein